MAARQPIVYFYVIPFDNLKDDPTIEWISSGLSDMVSNKFKNCLLYTSPSPRDQRGYRMPYYA